MSFTFTIMYVKFICVIRTVCVVKVSFAVVLTIIKSHQDFKLSYILCLKINMRI